MKCMKKKKELINPIMNSKRIKSNNTGVGEDDDVKSFIKIIIVMAVILLLIYGITFIINRDKKENSDISINYDKMTVGMLFNRPYDEYYALIYNSDDSKSNEYSSMLSTYKQKKDDKDYIKIYEIDLNNKLNKGYYNKDKSNPKASSLEELQFGNITLIKIKNKKIVEYIESIDEIEKKLS